MNESIGQQLRQARERRSLTLELAARMTRIRLHYLKALEAGDLDTLPSSTQGRGFLRVYADYLGLDANALLAEWNYPTGANQAVPIESIPANAVDTAQSDGIFLEIGQKLRLQRELLGLSLEDVERHTHLRSHYLKILEAGDLKGLPSPVQGRGMLKNYATFLGMDPEPLLLRFAEGLQALLVARQASINPGRRATKRKTRRRIPLFPENFPSDLAVGGLLIVLLVGFIIWGALRITSLRSSQEVQAPLPTARSISDVLLITSTPTQTAIPTRSGEQVVATLPIVIPTETLEVTEVSTGTIATEASSPQPALKVTAQATSVVSGSGVLQLNLVVRERAWMRVMVDGKTEFEGRVVPGSAYQFSGDKRIELLYGNGAALQVIYNQQDLGILAGFGEVVFRVFTLDGVATPTATLTPTRAPVTPTPTTNPTGSKPTNSPTPTPTPTITRIP